MFVVALTSGQCLSSGGLREESRITIDQRMKDAS